MKKRLLTSVVMLFSASLFAGEPGNAVVVPSGIHLVVPDNVGIWSIGAEVFFASPESDNFVYGQLQELTTPSELNYNLATHRTRKFGGTVDAAYLIPEKAQDIKVSFTNVKFNDSTESVLNLNEQFVLPTDALETVTGAGSFVHGSEGQHYVSSDLLFGQWHRSATLLDSHLFGGVRYLNLHAKSTGTYYDTNTGVTQSLEMHSYLEGIGPRVGAEESLHLGWGISVIAEAGLSIVVGEIDSDTEALNPASPSGVNTVNDEEVRVSPEGDARFGVDYVFNFTDTMSASAQLGYQVVTYLNAIDKNYIDVITPNSDIQSSNFGYRGPYFRMQVNVA